MTLRRDRKDFACHHRLPTYTTCLPPACLPPATYHPPLPHTFLLPPHCLPFPSHYHQSPPPAPSPHCLPACLLRFGMGDSFTYPLPPFYLPPPLLPTTMPARSGRLPSLPGLCLCPRNAVACVLPPSSLSQWLPPCLPILIPSWTGWDRWDLPAACPVSLTSYKRQKGQVLPHPQGQWSSRQSRGPVASLHLSATIYLPPSLSALLHSHSFALPEPFPFPPTFPCLPTTTPTTTHPTPALGGGGVVVLCDWNLGV